jgi:hypothetical protein
LTIKHETTDANIEGRVNEAITEYLDNDNQDKFLNLKKVDLCSYVEVIQARINAKEKGAKLAIRIGIAKNRLRELERENEIDIRRKDRRFEIGVTISAVVLTAVVSGYFNSVFTNGKWWPFENIKKESTLLTGDKPNKIIPILKAPDSNK